MRLALLDTNIVVSAAIQRMGPSGQIVMEALDGRIQLVTCPRVIAEYREVVHRPGLAKKGLRNGWTWWCEPQPLTRIGPRSGCDL